MIQDDFDKVDAFLKKEKTILSNVQWNQKGDKKNLFTKIPLAENEELIIDFDFEADAHLCGMPNMQGGNIKILHRKTKEKMIVCRMHILPGNPHTNPFIEGCDKSGLYFPPRQTRFYSWENMKKLRLSHCDNSKHIAETIDNVNSYEESLKFFLSYTHISGNIPLPSYELSLF